MFQSPTALWLVLTGSADCAAAVGVHGGMVFIHGEGHHHQHKNNWEARVAVVGPV
jgi:hypothetical protein